MDGPPVGQQSVKNLIPFMHSMQWVLVLVSVVVSGLLGHHIGAKRERDAIAAELMEQQAKLVAVEQQNQAREAQLRTQRNITDASNQSLQKMLRHLQAKSFEQKSTQLLYENIEGKDRSSGLDVGAVTHVNGENGKPNELHITVVQARGRGRVKGQIGVALVGEQSGEPWRQVIMDKTGDSASKFDMRFYQTLTVPLPEQENHIDIVEIYIEPDGKRHKSVSYATSWSSILED